jgi:hypothetical protein
VLLQDLVKTTVNIGVERAMGSWAGGLGDGADAVGQGSTFSCSSRYPARVCLSVKEADASQ